MSKEEHALRQLYSELSTYAPRMQVTYDNVVQQFNNPILSGASVRDLTEEQQSVLFAMDGEGAMVHALRMVCRAFLSLYQQAHGDKVDKLLFATKDPLFPTESLFEQMLSARLYCVLPQSSFGYDKAAWRADMHGLLRILWKLTPDLNAARLRMAGDEDMRQMLELFTMFTLMMTSCLAMLLTKGTRLLFDQIDRHPFLQQPASFQICHMYYMNLEVVNTNLTKVLAHKGTSAVCNLVFSRRRLALCQALHERVGEGSAIKVLGADLLRMIADFSDE